MEAKEANSTIPIIERFLDALEVGVPLPEITTEEQETYENYEKRVDAYLTPLLSPELMEPFLRESDPEMRRKVMEDVMKYCKSLFLNAWIRKNNAFPEFDEMFFVEGKPNPELIKSLLNFSGTASELLADICNAYYEARNPEGGDGEDNSTSTNEDTTIGGSGDEFGGAEETTEETPVEEGDPTKEEPTEEEEKKSEEEGENEEVKKEEETDKKEDDPTDDEILGDDI